MVQNSRSKECLFVLNWTIIKWSPGILSAQTHMYQAILTVRQNRMWLLWKKEKRNEKKNIHALNLTNSTFQWIMKRKTKQRFETNLDALKQSYAHSLIYTNWIFVFLSALWLQLNDELLCIHFTLHYLHLILFYFHHLICSHSQNGKVLSCLAHKVWQAQKPPRYMSMDFYGAYMICAQKGQSMLSRITNIFLN